jgi:hypothetical protein
MGRKSNEIVITVVAPTPKFKLSIDAKAVENGRIYPIAARVYVNDAYVGDTPITKEVEKGKYKIQVSATPPLVFWYWGDGSTENPRTIDVDRDVSLTAYFRYALTISIDSLDQYGLKAPAEIYVDDKYVGEAPVTAPIDAGSHKIEARSKMPWLYSWWKWSDGVTQNPRTIYILAPTSLTAYFTYLGGGM